MPWLSFWEIGMVLIVALLVLGPKRLPALAKMLGKATRNLQRMSADLRDAIGAPLEEVRKPLSQMRDDLYETASQFEQQMRQEVDPQKTVPKPVAKTEDDHDPYAPGQADDTTHTDGATERDDDAQCEKADGDDRAQSPKRAGG